MLSTFCLTALAAFWIAESTPDLVSTRCSSRPDLPECRSAKLNAERKILYNRLNSVRRDGQNDRRRGLKAPLSDRQRKEIADFTAMLEKRRRKDNVESPNGAITKSHIDADLREKEFGGGNDNLEEGFLPEDTEEIHSKPKNNEAERETEEDTEDFSVHRGSVEAYCNEYEEHFAFYCIGESNDNNNDEKAKVISKFCPTYKKACPNKSITKTASIDEAFTRKVSIKTPEEESDESDEITSSEEEDLERRDAMLEEIKRRIPCTPFCDEKVYPHCTQECKCDYSYPSVQNFCNPPPLPFFLNVCRLWYYMCPKYERYHYASQYIYSKAEKGKHVPGPRTTNPNPFNIPSPPGHPHIGPEGPESEGGEARAEGTRTRSVNRHKTKQTMIVPPALPSARDQPLRRSGSPRNMPSSSRQSHTTRGRTTNMKKSRHQRRRYRTSSHSHRSTRHQRASEKPRRTMRAINPQTAEPMTSAKDRWTAGSSDLTNGSGDDTFQAISSLSDHHGIHHRPRSRGPFTKPGLWEPNPDNPHNRDHANKWFYKPYSTTADWLNGEVASGGHWAVPAAGVGGTNFYEGVFFPSLGTFLNINDDYDYE